MTDTAAERLRATEKNELHRQHLYRVLDKSQLSTVRRKRGGKQASIFKPQTKQISATDDAAASSPNVQMGDNPCRLRGQKQSIDLCQCQSRRQTAQRLSLSLSPPASRYRTASVSGCQLAWQWVNTKPLLSDWLAMSDTITCLCHGAAHARCRVYSYPRRTWQRVSRSVDTAGGTRGAGPVCQM